AAPGRSRLRPRVPTPPLPARARPPDSLAPTPWRVPARGTHVRTAPFPSAAPRRQPRSRRLDGECQLAVPTCEQHLFPAPELVPEPLVSPRLRRLTFQRPTLFLHFEDDVVNAGKVLLRRLQL